MTNNYFEVRIKVSPANIFRLLDSRGTKYPVWVVPAPLNTRMDIQHNKMD